MARRVGRILMLAIAVEALTILTLVLLVAVLGPSEPDAAQAYAQRLGYWVGPIAGFCFCVAGGWLAARGVTTHPVRTGLLLGAVVAAIDIALIVAAGSPFEPIFAVSNVGRLVAGSLGGWLAGRARAV